MQAVAAWREREARERNVPRGRVLKDDAIYEIAQQAAARCGSAWPAAHHAERLGALGDGNRAARRGQRRARAAEGSRCRKLPKSFQPPEGSSAAAELLKVLLRLVAEKEGVAAKVLASSDDIDRIAAEGEDADVPALHGWRRDVFGEAALQAGARRDRASSSTSRKIAVFDL